MSDLKFNFIIKNQLKILNDKRHTRTSGTSKMVTDLTIVFPSLQSILSWIVTGSPLSSDHCLITVNIQSKNSEPQTTITKFNTSKVNWYLFKSNETKNHVTNQNRSQSAEALTEDFHKKKSYFFQNLLYKWEKKKHFSKPWSSSHLRKPRDKEKQIYKLVRKTKCEQHLIQWKKSRADFKILPKKNTNEEWE